MARSSANYYGEEDDHLATMYEMDWAEQDWADRWHTAWDILEPLGVVSHPEDSQLPLNELERLASLVGSTP